MSDTPINQMDFKQLRNEVQLLRDELAIMKRKYEDVIYNLDTENFSQRIVKQGKNLYTKIEQTADEIVLQSEKIDGATDLISSLQLRADGISTEVSKVKEGVTENKTLIEQTAESIKTMVSDTDLQAELEKYSTIEQTENRISASVAETKEYAEGFVTDALAKGGYVTNATFKAQFDIYTDEIYSEVEEIYETKSDANASYSSINSSITNVRQTANSISTRVGKVENGEFGDYTLFTQTADKFTFVGNVEISGDSVVGGTIVGSSLKNSDETHTLTMTDDNGSGYGTFCLYNQYYEATPYFSIYDDTFGRLNIKGAGETFLSTHTLSKITVTPQGIWDFENANVTGLRITFG